MRAFLLILFCLISGFNLFSQSAKIQKLDEILIESTRIDIPFRKESRSIQVLTAEDFKDATSNSLAEVLQHINGIDIRRRGTDGMQADLYIRGGSFDQTLVLIDGIKTENPQTGHHTMNMMIPLETIERIEIIKGPASRIYGQNAFTGAINIVTKKTEKTSVKGKAGYGSFDRKHFELTGSLYTKNAFHQVHYSRMISDGYRYNTDFKNNNLFWKSRFNTQKIPVALLATFMDRKFGANGFYASPEYKDQYEETQSSLVGVSTQLSRGDWIVKPRIYWKRGQDMYEFVRGKPEIYRNLHITNKIGVTADASLSSTLGKTGFGIDFSQVFISSNNLGNHQRQVLTAFLEQRFLFINESFDVTPGVAITYFSDFKFHAFPGIDIGFQWNEHFRVYANTGYTYRIPTYTDLYYESPTTIGNPDLNPESALSGELGLKYFGDAITSEAAFFIRKSDNLIDYVKDNESDPWQARNIQDLLSKGIELSLRYDFNMLNLEQYLTGGYTFLDEDLKRSDYAFSQYSINSMRHQFTAAYVSRFWKYLSQSLSYRYVSRQDGYEYHLVDLKLNGNYKGFDLSFILNNLFDTVYTETNFVPMPGRNFMLKLSYTFH